MEIPPAIGIDLGTTYSCAAVFRHGYVEIIPNEQKSNTTPSCVAFTDKQRLIGEEAKLQAARNARNTVYDVKRLIGRKYDDEPVQKDVKQFPFKVEKRDGKPIISVQYKEETKEHTPEEISSMILIKMKQVAEKYLECEISKAVITIPAYFNDAQRESTKIAGKIAGLDVIRVINEPTAAALAYGLDRISEAEKNILVFDLGGGTFDVSILAIEEGVFEIKATTGDTHLGGEDFNNLLVKHFVREFHKKYSKNLNDDQNGLQYLRDQCEYAKCKLSKEETAQIEIKFENIDYDFFITRDLFEELCGELFMSTLKHVEDALNDAKLKKSDINDIVLVGGSTRIPKIQQLLSEFFHGKKLNNTIDPDEVVANGAAIQAAILTGVDADVLQDILLMDVTPFSLGVKTIDGEMKKVVARNITIPVTKTEMFSTTVDNQTSVLVQVYEGERARVEDNNLLGRFQLTGIEKAPRKYPQIEVTFKIDENGILCVSAEDKRTGSQNKIIIKNNKDLLTKEQIDQMIRVAEQYRKDDELFLETIKKLQSLRDYVYYVKTIANQASFNQEIVAYERQQVENKITETLIWIAKAGEHAQIEDIDQIRKEFELVCNPVLEKYKSNYGNSSSPNDGSSSGSNSQGTFTRKNTFKKSPFIEEIDDDDDDDK